MKPLLIAAHAFIFLSAVFMAQAEASAAEVWTCWTSRNLGTDGKWLNRKPGEAVVGRYTINGGKAAMAVRRPARDWSGVRDGLTVIRGSGTITIIDVYETSDVTPAMTDVMVIDTESWAFRKMSVSPHGSGSTTFFDWTTEGTCARN